MYISLYVSGKEDSPSDDDTWVILGQRLDEDRRHGLNQEVENVNIVDGPHGLKAWQFNGTESSYVKTACPDGIQGASFTIATYIYQDEKTHDAPIFECSKDGK